MNIFGGMQTLWIFLVGHYIIGLFFFWRGVISIYLGLFLEAGYFLGDILLAGSKPRDAEKLRVAPLPSWTEMTQGRNDPPK